MILVTGGAGYIGSHVNLVLTEMGHGTVVLDDLSLGHRELADSGELVVGDFGDADLVGQLITTHAIDTVVHLAAFTDVDDSIRRPADYYANNVVKTLRLLDTLVARGVRRFVFSSTSAVYAENSGALYREDDLKKPLCPYGRSKLFIETVLEDYRLAYGMEYVAFRYFNAAGADPKGRIGEWHEPEPHLIPVILDVALGRRADIKIFGTDYPTRDGTCVRDFIHVMDIAGAHALAIEHLAKGRASGAFNLGYGTGYTVAEVIEACRRVTGRPIPAIPSGRRPGDGAASIADCVRAKEVLGWRPGFADLDEIIRSAWAWHRRLHGVDAPP